jgi:hypothetical protein
VKRAEPVVSFAEDAHAFFWLVGILEGEGTFCHAPPSRPGCPSVQVEMTDEDTVARVARMFGVAYHSRQPTTPGWSRVYRCKISGRQALVVMRAIAPYMSARRRVRIAEILDRYAAEGRRAA